MQPRLIQLHGQDHTTARRIFEDLIIDPSSQQVGEVVSKQVVWGRDPQLANHLNLIQLLDESYQILNIWLVYGITHGYFLESLN